MRGRTIALLATVVVLALVAAFIAVPLTVAKGKYDEAKQKYEKELPDPFAVQEIDSTTAEMLREIEAKWSCGDKEMGGPYSQAMETAGMAPTAANLAELFNYRMPSYAWFSPGENAKALSIAAVQATIVPISTDQTIHISADRSLALILHSDSVASVFRETESGLQEELWTKKSIEPKNAGERDIAPTGLTVVVCDSANKVLDTLVVPREMETGNFEFTVPENLDELRVFAVGNRIIGIGRAVSGSGGKMHQQFRKELSEALTKSYFVARSEESGGLGFVDAEIEQGVLTGISGGEAPRPLKLTNEMRNQIREDIAAGKRAPIIYRLETETEFGGRVTRVLAD